MWVFLVGASVGCTPPSIDGQPPLSCLALCMFCCARWCKKDYVTRHSGKVLSPKHAHLHSFASFHAPFCVPRCQNLSRYQVVMGASRGRLGLRKPERVHANPQSTIPHLHSPKPDKWRSVAIANATLCRGVDRTMSAPTVNCPWKEGRYGIRANTLCTLVMRPCTTGPVARLRPSRIPTPICLNSPQRGSACPSRRKGVGSSDPTKTELGLPTFTRGPSDGASAPSPALHVPTRSPLGLQPTYHRCSLAQRPHRQEGHHELPHFCCPHHLEHSRRRQPPDGYRHLSAEGVNLVLPHQHQDVGEDAR